MLAGPHRDEQLHWALFREQVELVESQHEISCNLALSLMREVIPRGATETRRGLFPVEHYNPPAAIRSPVTEDREEIFAKIGVCIS